MNDFTKEELIEIRDYCNWDQYDFAHSDFIRNLRLKIDAMIESFPNPYNGCLHNWVVMVAGINSPFVYCQSCRIQKPPIDDVIFTGMMRLKDE